VTCRASDAPATVAKLMGAKKVRRVPVTDEGGRLVGLVSMGDLLCAAADAPREKKALHAALVDALTSISARTREEVAPAPPAKKRAAAPKNAKPNGKKRARV